MSKQLKPIIEVETRVLEMFLASSKYKACHDLIKEELNFRKKHFNPKLSLQQNNNNNFKSMVKAFKGE